MKKLLAVLLITCSAAIDGGTYTTSSQILDLANRVDQMLGLPNIEVSINQVQGINAYYYPVENKIELTQGLVRAYLNGSVSMSQLMLVICHELGHSQVGSSERGSDLYAIAALVTLKNKGYDVDPRNAIEYFGPGGAGAGLPGDSVHPSSVERHTYMKAYLDQLGM